MGKKLFLQEIKGLISLFQKKVTEKRASALEKFLDFCFLTQTEILSIGFMMARSLNGIRWVISNSQFSHLQYVQTYLKELGYLYEIQPLIVCLEKLGGLVEKYFFSFDHSETVGPRLGVEFSAKSATENNYILILKNLEAQCLITPAQREAVLAWVGYEILPSPDWSGNREYFLRRISHLKLVYHPLSNIELKIYFAFERFFNKVELHRSAGV